MCFRRESKERNEIANDRTRIFPTSDHEGRGVWNPVPKVELLYTLSILPVIKVEKAG